MKFLSGLDIRIVKVWNQESSMETSTKTSSTSEVTGRREANTPTNRTKGYTMAMLNKSSP